MPVQVVGGVRPNTGPGSGPPAERQGVRLPRARLRVRPPLELLLQPRGLQAHRLGPPRRHASLVVGLLWCSEDRIFRHSW